MNIKGSEIFWSILARRKILEEVVKVTIKQIEQEMVDDGRLHSIKNGYISVLYFASQVVSR